MILERLYVLFDESLQYVYQFTNNTKIQVIIVTYTKCTCFSCVCNLLKMDVNKTSHLTVLKTISFIKG